MTADRKITNRASQISDGRGVFDRVAEWGSNLASRGPFAALCVGGLIAWLVVAGPLMDYSDRWIALGAFCMAAVTFLMLALLENAQRRSDQATQRKLNAVAEALALVLEAGEVDGREVEELRAAIGLEHRESTSALKAKTHEG